MSEDSAEVNLIVDKQIPANCNCGRPVRYETPTGWACNKYMVCPTREQLEQKVIGLVYAGLQLKENDWLECGNLPFGTCKDNDFAPDDLCPGCTMLTALGAELPTKQKDSDEWSLDLSGNLVH